MKTGMVPGTVLVQGFIQVV